MKEKKESINEFSKRMRELAGLSESKEKRTLSSLNEFDHEDYELEDRKVDIGINPELDTDDFDSIEFEQSEIEEGADDSELYNLNENTVIVLDFINEEYQDEERFEAHGFYTVSNLGGYEIMISDDGDSAKVKDAYGSGEPKISDWLEIEHIPGEDDELEAVIDPSGYNIPLNQVMRLNR